MRTSSTRRRWLAGLGATALVATLTVGWGWGTAPVQAAPGDVVITGHGYGHGRGLSQYGSYGYATAYGWNHLQILSHYYSNASLGDAGNPQLGVRLMALEGQATTVYSGTTFSVGGYYIDPGVTAQISRNPDGTWLLSTRLSCTGAVTGTAQIPWPTFDALTDPGNDINQMLTTCGTNRSYRGSLFLAWDGALHTVNYLSTQDYLRGVVPRESPASWGDANGGSGMNALMAQTVAARSYALAESRTAYAKTCDTTSCQVYGGAGVNGQRIEDARTDNAVAWTSGQVMMLNGAIARTEFSSSSGGYTAGGTFPAVPDDGDAIAANPYYNWSATVPGSTVSSAFGVGSLVSLTVLTRNGLGAEGGRVTKIRVTGLTKSVDVTGNDFRSALGLRSDWFSIAGIQPTAPPITTTVKDATTGGIPDVSPTQTSAVVAGNGMTTVFARGTDAGIWYRTGSGLPGYGPGYGPWMSIPSTRTTSGPAVVAVNGSRVDIVVRGADGAYWYNAAPLGADGRPTSFIGWSSMGGNFTTAPSIASIADGRVAVAGRGGNGSIYVQTWNGSYWSGWIALGGTSYSAPSLSADVANQQYVVSVVGSDGRVWKMGTGLTVPYPTSAWTGSGVGSTLTPGASGASWTGGQDLDLLVGGPDHSAVMLARDNSTRPLGGAFSSVISVAPQADGSYYLYGRGADLGLWMARYVNGQVSDWMSLGGTII